MRSWRTSGCLRFVVIDKSTEAWACPRCTAGPRVRVEVAEPAAVGCVFCWTAAGKAQANGREQKRDWPAACARRLVHSDVDGSFRRYADSSACFEGARMF
jgi:hypothetical protein